MISEKRWTKKTLLSFVIMLQGHYAVTWNLLNVWKSKYLQIKSELIN